LDIPINQVSNLGAIASQMPIKRETADIEFSKIFYKEMLKQVFTASDNPNALITKANQDILIDKLAEEMARKNLIVKDIH